MLANPYMTPGRRAAQIPAPGARQRGAVQNAAISASLAPGASAEPREVGQPRPDVSRPMASPTPPLTPAPAGAPTPGQAPISARGAADFNRLGGGFGRADTDSMKHRFGRIAQHYGPNQGGLDAMLNDAEFRNFFPNAKKAGFDKIDFGQQFDPHSGSYVGTIDVGKAFDPNAGTGESWQWLDPNEAQPVAPASAFSNLTTMGNSSYAEQILQYLRQQLATQNALRG